MLQRVHHLNCWNQYILLLLVTITSVSISPLQNCGLGRYCHNLIFGSPKMEAQNLLSGYKQPVTNLRFCLISIIKSWPGHTVGWKDRQMDRQDSTEDIELINKTPSLFASY